jgi:hypothetical protein
MAGAASGRQEQEVGCQDCSDGYWNEVGRCVFAAKQKPHRPGIAPALGLRAGGGVYSLYRGP